MIQLTKENEKSEPFSYWKKVRILCLCLKGQHFIQYGGNKKRENTT